MAKKAESGGDLPRDWSPILDTLHAALVARMEKDQSTAYAVGKAIGIDVGSLAKFLKRQRGLSWNRAETLAAYLGLTIAVLKRPKGK
jgi:hypothetical protein